MENDIEKISLETVFIFNEIPGCYASWKLDLYLRNRASSLIPSSLSNRLKMFDP